MLNSLIEQASDINTHPDILRKLALESFELAHVVAKNFGAPPDILIALSILIHNKEIRRSLAANPNTPVEGLILLGADFPHELINNSAFQSCVLKNPGLFQQIPIQTVKSIIRLNDIPAEYLVMAASCNNIDILTIIANHPKAPRYLLLWIINHIKMSDFSYMPLGNIAYIASQNVNYAGEITEGWDKEVTRAIQKYTFLHRNKEKEEFLYNVGILDKNLLLELSPYTYLKMIAKSETPSDIAEFILDAFNPEMRSKSNLSQPDNLSTYVNQLIELNDAKIVRILTIIAENPNSSLFVLSKLAVLNNSEIKQAIYHNYNTSDSILKILFQIDNSQSNSGYLQKIRESSLLNIKNYLFFEYPFDLASFGIDNSCKLLFLSDNIDNVCQKLKNINSYDILIAFARHSKTPAHLLEHVHTQSQYHRTDSPQLKNLKKAIRILLAKNPQVPTDILLNLAEDEYCQVGSEAITNLKNNPTLDNQRITELLEQWEHANNPAAPQHILSSIALNCNAALCLAVANNPSTNAKTLYQLAVDLKGDVLIAVAKNPNTSVKTLLMLSRKGKASLNIRAQAVKALIQKDPKQAGAVLVKFVSSDEPTSARFILLLHPIAPQEFLAQHAHSICWIERYAVAQNPSTPGYLLSKLSTDANRLVRAAALARLQAS